MHHLLFDFVCVGLVEIEVRDEVNLELEKGKELALLVDDLLLCDGSMRYLLRYYLGVEGINVLILRSQVHRDNTHEMYLGVLPHYSILQG